VGRTLRATLLGCPTGATVTYHWLAGRKPIRRATGATYEIPASKAGSRIRVEVTVSAEGYVDAQRLSRPTRKVR
jgi:hypothetical protein